MRHADEQRLIRKFVELTAIDSMSLQERKMADTLKSELEELGFEVTEDKAADIPGAAAGNLYGYLKGNLEGSRPVLFSAHMDTVDPGYGKKARTDRENGIITSGGDTVLGADDVSGIAEILEGVRLAAEDPEGHGDIEVLFTVGEEIYGKGAWVFDYNRLISEECYVVDMSGPVGAAVLRAPSIISFEAVIKGRAAHAGSAPETGINALQCASKAIAKMKLGRISADTTFNVGTIKAGTVNNIVPETCVCTGECRSFDHEEAVKTIRETEALFEKYASEAGARLEFTSEVHIKAYETGENEPVCRDFKAACDRLGFEGRFVPTHIGSDNNIFAEFGLRGLVISSGMQNIHSTEEYIRIVDLIRGAELIAALIEERRR